MVRSRRFVLLVAALVAAIAWGVLAPTATAQSDDVTIQLNFMTATGEAPDQARVLDLDTGVEYRNAGVANGEPIEVVVPSGTVARLAIRGTELQPGEVRCEGSQTAEVVSAPSGATLAITPATAVVTCDVTLLDQLPNTGLSSSLAMAGFVWLAGGMLLLAASRSRIGA